MDSRRQDEDGQFVVGKADLEEVLRGMVSDNGIYQQAVSEAEHRGREQGEVAARIGMAIDLNLILLGEMQPSPNGIYERIYGQGQRDERARIRAGVEALRGQVAEPWGEFIYREVLPVIDGTAPQGGE
jgi:hypothetical protein